ncbi:MAG TPA: HD domain-containing protein [Chromobacteriaceae bacterium]|nr:HD domain-containing protein [Chromobacteriaceae bacterium]
MIHPKIESLDELFALMVNRGQTLYGGETVSQLEHALQSALAAERDGANAALITAALLHDIGHIVAEQNDDDVARGLNDCHEALAAQVLAGLFADDVRQPILLHVAAKRYLCATQPAYYDTLSVTSRQSLALQGGPMSLAEAERFSNRAYATEALALRRYDDMAKTPNLVTPALEHYRAIAATVLKA